MAIIADNPNFASDDISDEAPKTIDECLDALSQDIRGIQLLKASVMLLDQSFYKPSNASHSNVDLFNFQISVYHRHRMSRKLHQKLKKTGMP